MTKVAASLVAIMMALTFTAVSGGESMAQRSTKGGYCPAGTCGKDGRSIVRDLKNCKKEHCKKK